MGHMSLVCALPELNSGHIIRLNVKKLTGNAGYTLGSSPCTGFILRLSGEITISHFNDGGKVEIVFENHSGNGTDALSAG